jgi:hypothetical protein
MMKQITLEFNNELEMVRILEILRQFDVRIIQKIPKRNNKKQSIEDFYDQFNLNISSFKFTRDEANER